MGDFSWALRIALLVVGIAIVGAVYVLGVVRRRQRNRRYSSGGSAWRRRAREQDELPDVDLDRDPTDDVVGPVRVRKIEPLPELPVIRNDAVQERPAAALAEAAPAADDRPARSRRARRKQAQLDFGFETPASANPASSRNNPDQPPPEPALLTFYLRPIYGPAFVGPTIVRNANAVGMKHGDMQVFHHFGAGDLRTERALFSLANMFEPGSFDLQRIEAFQTAGLVMFLHLPAPLDGPVAFELFLNTAQRLAEGLQAELLSDPKTVLDSAGIEQMRRIAAKFPTHA
ncbi:MAG: cell division protein ZipA C-terminal FtsZ-binding domain-containing protein [Gammaproteobacteria bacterium]